MNEEGATAADSGEGALSIDPAIKAREGETHHAINDKNKINGITYYWLIPAIGKIPNVKTH